MSELDGSQFLETITGSAKTIRFQSGDLTVDMKVSPITVTTGSDLVVDGRKYQNFSGVFRTIDYRLTSKSWQLPAGMKVREVLEIASQSHFPDQPVLEQPERTVNVSADGTFSDVLLLGASDGLVFPPEFKQFVRQRLYLHHAQFYPRGRLLAMLNIERSTQNILVTLIAPLPLDETIQGPKPDGRILTAEELKPAPSTESVPKFSIRESDFVMNQKDASTFATQTVGSILRAGANDETELPALRSRIREIVLRIIKKQLVYLAIPAYYPDRSVNAIAKLDEYQGKLSIMLFVPTVLEWREKLSAEDFKYAMLITFAHEMIHIEQNQDYVKETLEEAAREEAVAWGKTIIEIIRPLLAEHKMSIPDYVRLSDYFKSLNDDSANADWVKVFMMRRAGA